MALSNIQRAEALTRLGIWVFPVYVRPDPENPYKNSKKPGTPNGFYDATNDPGYVMDLFERHTKAEVGVWMGPSGLVAADIDVKRDPEGTVLVDGFEEFDKAWLSLPETHSFDSISGAGGKQFIYSAPEGVNLGPAGKYRGIEAVDRRGGNSYSVWVGDIPTSRDVFTPAPEWLLDEATVRSASIFEGDVKAWYETLEPGEPSLIVRAAMDRTREVFESAGKDFDHAAMIERQFEAVRLGAEGHPGVDQLLALIEELFMSRTGSHSRGEGDWEYEFQESLASAVEKYGDAISLRKELPEYTPSLVPAGIPDRLFLGAPGRKADFTALLRALLDSTDDNLIVTSVLWNAPKTKEMAREWGLEFTHKRVLAAREKPEPVKENPSLQAPEKAVVKEVQKTSEGGAFMSAEEVEIAESTHTFIDTYLAASLKKGFNVPAYDIPAAWTALSMTFGTRAVLSYNGLGTNLWFIKMGNTGTGKSQSHTFGKAVLDLTMKENDSYYNVGASSSPAAIHEELLMRDGKASMILHDEAASFFSDLANQEWSKTLEHHFSSFYDGEVEPSNKVRLPKELRGKHARTSFGLNMSATPDKLLSLLNTGMFESGFLSRVNWTWTPDRAENDDIFRMGPSNVDANVRTHPAVYDLAADLRSAGESIQDGSIIGATPEAWERLSQAAKAMYTHSKGKERFETLKGPLTRLRETSVKCAALLAMYRGETTFTLTDALVAIRYVSEWYESMVRVVNETSESDFSRDCNEIESYVRLQGEVSGAKLNHRFRNFIKRSPRELSDRIDFLVESGRLLADRGTGSTVYRING